MYQNGATDRLDDLRDDRVAERRLDRPPRRTIVVGRRLSPRPGYRPPRRSGRPWYIAQLMAGSLWLPIASGRAIMKTSLRTAATPRRRSVARNNERRSVTQHPRRRILIMAAGAAGAEMLQDEQNRSASSRES